MTPEDADAVVFYLKNVLPAVNNEVPAASLNEGFMVIAPEAQNQSPTSELATSPVILVIVGIGVILTVSFIAYFSRRKSA